MIWDSFENCSFVGGGRICIFTVIVFVQPIYINTPEMKIKIKHTQCTG